jgi:ectoine hydroxylase-related dioxygenase (phytanoyl-CoA dioxygenase family)
VIHVDPSPAERRRGVLSGANLERVLVAMQRDGVLVIDQIIDHAPLDALKQRMDRDSVELLAFCDSIGGNPRDRGHLQQGPPPMVPYVFPGYVANALVCDALRAILGTTAYCEFYNGNTNCPDSTYQELHLDAVHSSSVDGVAAATSAVVVNVVPQDVDERNGAVELWPGTHTIVVPTPVPDAAIEARRAAGAPVRGAFRKGDVLLRDSRLWHRGVPNPSQEYRHMIAMVFVSGGKPKGRPIAFARDCEWLLANAPLPFNATFSDEPIDYLLGPTKRMQRALQGPRAAQVARH